MIVRVAREAGAREGRLADIRLALSEACTNAIKHAYRAPGVRGAAFDVSSVVHQGVLCVWVVDDGRGFAPEVPEPGLGLGLGLMAELSDRLVLGVLDDGGTQIEMHFELAPRRGDS